MLTSKVLIAVLDALYWTLPKINEISLFMVNLTMGKPLGSIAPLLSSALFGAACLALGTTVFTRKDY
jgi:hypothetical protein